MAENATPHPTDVFVGHRIRLARKSAEPMISQEKLATALKITFQQVQKYERGANRISASKLLEVARALKRPVSWFFQGLEGPSPDVGSEGEELSLVFIGLPGGLDLAATYKQLSPINRRRVLKIARMLTGDDID